MVESKKRMIAGLNERLDEIWIEHCASDPNALVPLYHHQFEPGGFLFVGMNPSFSEKAIDRGLRKQGTCLNDVRSHFLWTNRDNFQIETSLLLDEWARREYSYFRPFHSLAKSVNSRWHHLDIYAIRATNQKMVNQYLAARPTFGEAQLEVFDNALELFAPDIVVVANAKASDTLKARYQPNFDHEAGFHWVKIKDRATPIFFSGMWTGQRALDTHSRERMIWHIKQAHANLRS